MSPVFPRRHAPRAHHHRASDNAQRGIGETGDTGRKRGDESDRDATGRREFSRHPDHEDAPPKQNCPVETGTILPSDRPLPTCNGRVCRYMNS